MGIINIFNIEDLILCSNPKGVSTDGDPSHCLPLTLSLKENIEDIIDHLIFSTKERGYQDSKVSCQREKKTALGLQWFTDGEFRHLNQDLYEMFHAFNS